MRYYYKTKDGKGFLNLKEQLTENVNDYIEITESEFEQLTARPVITPNPKLAIKKEIRKYQKLLANSDYKAIKYAEGLISEEEYTPIKALRESYRAKINELEKEI